MVALLVLLALAVGALAGWIAASARARRHLDERERARAVLEVELGAERVRLEEAGRRLASQDAFLTESRRQIEDAFARLAQEALQSNSAQFASLSAQRIEPLKEALKGLESKTSELERARAQAYGSLSQQLGELARTTAALNTATATLHTKSEQLETALRGSAQARGRWGELALRNVVEAAGMTQHCDFVEQEVVEGGTRPDMIVRLPDEGGIPIDSKVPLANYWLAIEATDPGERRDAAKRHAEDVRRHMLELAKRDYSALIDGRIDFTVMFLTGDPLLALAFEHRPELLEEALARRVLIATPVTLVALLRTAAMLWRQKSVDENARAIAECAQDLFERLIVFRKHLQQTGQGLEKAREAYNKAVASFESRIQPAGRKLQELRGPGDAAPLLEELEPVEGELRQLRLTD